MPGFLCGYWNSNSGHDLHTSTLRIELGPQPSPNYIFKEYMHTFKTPQRNKAITLGGGAKITVFQS